MSKHFLFSIICLGIVGGLAAYSEDPFFGGCVRIATGGMVYPLGTNYSRETEHGDFDNNSNKGHVVIYAPSSK